MSEQVLGASFRDPSGFVFERDGLIHRQVNRDVQRVQRGRDAVFTLPGGRNVQKVRLLNGLLEQGL